MTSQKYSERLGIISDEQFQKALDKFNLGQFIKATQIKQGLFGQNVYVTSTVGEFVLRGVPHYNWQFSSEKFFVDLIYKNTKIPVPYPYNLDKDTDIFGWSYILMPRMTGINLSDNLDEINLTDNDRVNIAIAQGRTLADLHKLTWKHQGKYDLETKTVKPFVNSYFYFIKESIINSLEKAKNYNKNTTDHDIKRVNSLQEKTESLFHGLPVNYVMQDYKPGNMVVDKVGSYWNVTGLFDFMEGYFGFGESDLSRMYCVYLKQNREDLALEFVKSYINSSKLINIEHLKQRFPIFILLDRTIIWEYQQRNAADNGESFQKWVKPYLDLKL